MMPRDKQIPSITQPHCCMEFTKGQKIKTVKITELLRLQHRITEINVRVFSLLIQTDTRLTASFPAPERL